MYCHDHWDATCDQHAGKANVFVYHIVGSKTTSIIKMYPDNKAGQRVTTVPVLQRTKCMACTQGKNEMVCGR